MLCLPLSLSPRALAPEPVSTPHATLRAAGETLRAPNRGKKRESNNRLFNRTGPDLAIRFNRGTPPRQT
eukprot:11227022-Lingulodinium_polyedra.AAC.1